MGIADKLDGILTDVGCVINRDTHNLKILDKYTRIYAVNY